MIALDHLPRANRIALIGQKLHLDLIENDNRWWLEYCANFKVGNEYNPYIISAQSLIIHNWLIEHGSLETQRIPNTDKFRSNFRYTPEKFKNVLNKPVLISLARNNIKFMWCDLFICVNYPTLRMEKNSGQETLE